jgi:UrcA family protein
MYSNKSSIVQSGEHSISNVQSVSESITRIKKAVRAKSLAVAWVMLAFGPITYAADATQASDSVAHTVVRFKDLKLSSIEGATVLYGRLKSAANEVCGTDDKFNLSHSRAIKICINEAVSRAVFQINSPMLTSLYQSKTGKADMQNATLAQAP